MRIFVTGASTGIGNILSNHLSSQGKQVWGVSRSALSDDRNAFRLRSCDVSDWKSVEREAELVEKEWGALDALICCAGVQGAVGPAMECDPEKWSETVRINLDGTFFTIRGFFPLLKKSKARPKIICLSGGGATAPRPFFAAYGASKCAVVRLVETLAQEWKELNLSIDINTVAPGALPTRLMDEIVSLGAAAVGEKEYSQAMKVKESGLGAFEKVKQLTDFLLSSGSDGLSGRLISAPWDPWDKMTDQISDIMKSELYTLRRISEK